MDIEELDRDGNVVLVVEGESLCAKKFLVSSKVLGLASPVFAALFSRNFSEGNRIIEGNRPEITLKDDDPEAMRQILRTLHFKDPGDKTDPKMLAVLAIHCDKYACTEPLRPWVKVWSTGICADNPGRDYGYLLLAAHFFRLQELFTSVSAMAIRGLISSALLMWETDELLSLLPEQIKDDLAHGIEQLLDHVHAQVQMVERSLRNHKGHYRMAHAGCRFCRRIHSQPASTYHFCEISESFPSYCTVDSRVAEYFVVLMQADLWPSVAPFKECTASDIASRVSRANADFEHGCEAKRCPLKDELQILDGKVQGLVHDTPGYSLYPLHGSSADSGDDKVPGQVTTIAI